MEEAPCTSTILLSLPILLLLLALLFSHSSKNKKMTKGLPPSPPSLPILGHLHLLRRKPKNKALSAISAAYGPVLLLRFGSRPVLLISSASAAKECFTTNDLAFASRPVLPSLRRLSYNYLGLASSPYGYHWRNLRRISTIELFSSASLQSFAGVRAREVRRFLKNVAGGSSGEQWRTSELKTKVFLMVVNVIMSMVVGEGFCGEEEVETSEFRELRKTVEELAAMVSTSYISDYLPALRLIDRFQWTKRRLQSEFFARREAILQRLIDDQRRRKDSIDSFDSVKKRMKRCLMDVLLSLQQESTEYMTNETIKAFVQSLLVGGTNTMTETIVTAMKLLMDHPEALRKVRDEVDAAVGADERLVEERDFPNLPYLRAVFKETLRLCPAVPLLLPHEAREDCTVSGYAVEGGTMLMVNAWAIHRDPAEWDAPEEFRPERFVDGREEKMMIPFGMGRRGCPGETMAARLVPLVLGAMIQCFEWRKIGDQEEQVDMLYAGNTTLQVLCRPRQDITNSFLHEHFSMESYEFGII